MKKTNQTSLTVLIIVVVIIGIIVFYNPASEETIKIGASYPLSGPFATYGIEYQRGLEMAAEEINSQGGIGGKQIELIFEDDQGDVTQSVNSVNKLINIDGVGYLFTAFSSSSQATAPIAQQNKVLYISATVSKIGSEGDYVFRDYWDMEDQGKATGKAIKQEGLEKIGIIALNFADTEFFIRGLKSEAIGVKLFEERFNFGEDDFKTQLTKIKNFEPDAILVYGFPGAETIKITQQIKELGLNDKRLFGASQYGFYFMYSQFHDTLEKMEAIDSWYSLDGFNQKSKEFIQKYKTKYGKDLVGDAVYPYDDLYALKIAIENAENPKDTLGVAQELRKVNFDGAAGKLVFNEDGDSLRNAYLQLYTSEGWTKYEIK